jgi:hypothetical protein
LAGAFYGAEKIPAEWRGKLILHNFIVHKKQVSRCLATN